MRKLEFVVDDRQTLQRPQAHGLKAAFVTSGVLQQRLLKVVQRAQGPRHYKGLNGCIDLQRKNPKRSGYEPRHSGYGEEPRHIGYGKRNQDTVVMEQEPRHSGYGTGTKTLAMEKNQSAVVRGRGTKTQWLWNRNQDTGSGEEPKCSGSGKRNQDTVAMEKNQDTVVDV